MKPYEESTINDVCRECDKTQKWAVYKQQQEEIHRLMDELERKNLTIELIKDYAVVDFNEKLLKFIKEVEKDPKDFVEKRRRIK